jgi:hypothetical protein
VDGAGDAASAPLTNRALEKKLSALFDAGNDAMRQSRAEFWEGVKDAAP